MSLVIDAEVARGAFHLRVAAELGSRATGIFGPSGSGKSTLLQLIAGLIKPTRGSVTVGGEVLDDVAAGIHVPVHRRRIGLVFQHGHLFPHRSVAGNLRYGQRSGGKITFDAVVNLLALAPLLERRTTSLSGGERQRVALGRALLASPRLLLLDEPVAALDRGLKRQVLPYLRRVRSELGIPLIHVSHDLGELLQVTDDLLLIEDGAVAARGRLADLVEDPANLGRLHDLGLVNVLKGRLAANNADGTSTITLDSGRTLRAPLQAVPPGAACDLLIRPEDVILADAKTAGISAQNQFPGCVTAVSRAPTRTMVTVDIGEPFLVEISGKACDEMRLAPGAQVWCLCKAQSVLVG